jgi:hypothetical protein
MAVASENTTERARDLNAWELGYVCYSRLNNNCTGLYELIFLNGGWSHLNYSINEDTSDLKILNIPYIVTLECIKIIVNCEA